jgi:hypothetical protein
LAMALKIVFSNYFYIRFSALLYCPNRIH